MRIENGRVEPDFQSLLAQLLSAGQASELYDASIKTFWPSYNGDSGRLAQIAIEVAPEFASVADQQAEVRRIQRSDYAKEHWPKFAAAPEVRVVEQTGSIDEAWTHGEVNWAEKKVRNVTLHLPAGGWGRSRAVLLHELAHAVERWEFTFGSTNAGFRDSFGDGHGKRYAKLNVDMVREFYSKEMGDKLEANFKAGGVAIAA